MIGVVWLDLIGLVIDGCGLELVHVHFMISCMIMFVKETGFSCIAFMFMCLLKIGFSCEMIYWVRVYHEPQAEMGYYLGGAPLVTRERNILSDVPWIVAGRQWDQTRDCLLYTSRCV